MSDTPRTESELNRQKCWSDDLVTIDANFACQLERELNAANQIIRQQQLLEEENLRLTAKVAQLYEGAEEQKQRINRLQETGDYLCAAAAFMGWHDKIEDWNKAKEAKP